MANASLLNQKVQEIHLSNKLEQSGQIQLDSSFSLNVSFAPDGTRCIGRLTQTLRSSSALRLRPTSEAASNLLISGVMVLGSRSSRAAISPILNPSFSQRTLSTRYCG